MRKLLVLIAVAVLLVGCNKSGGSGTSVYGGTSDVSGSGSGDSIDSYSESNIPHNPEPATVALLGGGLAAYALMKFRKKKK